MYNCTANTLGANVPIRMRRNSGDGVFTSPKPFLEAFEKVSGMTGIPMQHTYSAQARAGDHICYISNLAKTRQSLKGWEITRSLDDIFEEIIAGWHDRQRSGP